MDIMVIEGDGIGPEIMDCCLKVIKNLNEKFNINMESVIYDINTRNLAEGKWNIEKVIEVAKKYKCILKAPLGNPKIRSSHGTEIALDVIIGLRIGLDLYANIRPVKLFPGINSPLRKYTKQYQIDYVILRENSEGLYASHFGGQILRDELALDTQVITRKGCERIFKMAFEMSRKSRGNPIRNEKIVTCVDKSNVLKSFAFFRKIFSEVSKLYPDIKANCMYADAMAQFMILHPEELNVIVTENMFGDILSDLGAATVGGLGLAYSANLSEEKGLFEPVHGSAPDIAGKGIANPIAMMMSFSLMLEWLGLTNYAKLIEKAIAETLKEGKTTPDLGGNMNSIAFTDEVIKKIDQLDLNQS